MAQREVDEEAAAAAESTDGEPEPSPAGLDPGSIEADYEDGVLTVSIKRRPEAQPQKISIGSGSRKLEG